MRSPPAPSAFLFFQAVALICCFTSAYGWAPGNKNDKRPTMNRIGQGFANSIAVAGLVCLAPLPSQAAQSIKIEANLPAIVQIAKDNKEDLIRLAKAAAQEVSLQDLPQDKIGFVRDAAAGDILLTVNGIPFDVSVRSEKGSVDVALAAEQGDISFTVSSQYLPKLPLLSKRYVPLTPEEAITRTIDRLEDAVSESVSIWDQKQLDIFGQGWTNTQVLGTTFLGTGLAYGGSYAYYDLENKRAEEKAERTKREKAQKRKEAAEAKKKKDIAEAEKKKKDLAEAANKKAAKKQLEVVQEKKEIGVRKPVVVAEPPVVESPFVVPQNPLLLQTKGGTRSVREERSRKWYKLWQR